MALLSAMMRTAHLSGTSAPVTAWLHGRQSGWWSAQYARPHADATQTLRDLTELVDRGVIDQREFETLRARTGA